MPMMLEMSGNAHWFMLLGPLYCSFHLNSQNQAEQQLQQLLSQGTTSTFLSANWLKSWSSICALGIRFTSRRDPSWANAEIKGYAVQLTCPLSLQNCGWLWVSTNAKSYNGHTLPSGLPGCQIPGTYGVYTQDCVSCCSVVSFRKPTPKKRIV